MDLQMAYAAGMEKSNLSITLAAPEFPVTEAFASFQPGYDAGMVEITVTVGEKSAWRIVRARALEVWCTVKCRLGFLIREYRRVLREFLMLWEVAASCINPERRVYAFRL